MNKRFRNTAVLCMSAVLFFCSCSNVTTDIQSTEGVASAENLSFDVADTEAVVKDDKVGTYKLHEMAPIEKDGKIYGWLTMNQSEKLGIFDWTSAKAVDSGIKKSYTFNFKVNYLTKLENGNIVTFYIKPYLIKSKKVIGKPCTVGWSGFPKTAVFDENTNEQYVENGMQPFKKSLKNAQLIVKVSDSNGVKYDDIQFSKSVLTKAKKGPSLRTDKKPVTITGASGAKYKVNISKVYKERCFDADYKLTDKDQIDNLSRIDTLMFNYRVDYVKKPKTKLQVGNIDRSKKSSCLSTDLKIGVSSDVDTTLNYTNEPSLSRWRYSDSLAMDYFTTDDRYKIHTGKYAYYTCNRVISENFYRNASAVRFQVEFNSDAMAMTPEELMKFDGRFIVFQKNITLRPLYPRKTHKVDLVIYTNDKNAR